MSKNRILKLREEFNSARSKGKHADVLEALRALSELEPEEPRWAHQEGDARRRMGDTPGAVRAFERATDLYAKAGFLARAVAMAKTLLLLDPSRTDVLERVDPKPAQRAHRKRRPTSVSSTAIERPADTPIANAAALLERDESAAEDETRFLEEDVEVELDISELELIDEPAEREAPIDQLALLPSFPLFAELPRARLARLAARSDLVELPAGAIVIRAGEPADALFCIVDGEVAVRVRGLERAPRVGAGDVFGESALLEGVTRNADVVVARALTALRIPREVLLEAVEGEPGLGDLLFELLARRLVANVVRTSPFFTPFPPKERKALARRFQLRRAARGVALIESGKRPDGLYVVVQGQVRAGRRAPRGPGTILGAEGLVGGASSETVKTSTECVLLRLPRARFVEIAQTHPPALAVIAELARGPEG